MLSTYLHVQTTKQATVVKVFISARLLLLLLFIIHELFVVN